MSDNNSKFDQREAKRQRSGVVSGIIGEKEKSSSRTVSNEKLKHAHFYIREDQHTALKVKAAKNGTDMSGMLRDMIDEYLKNHSDE